MQIRLSNEQSVAAPVAEHVRKVEAEVDVLKQLHHTNIVRYLVCDATSCLCEWKCLDERQWTEKACISTCASHSFAIGWLDTLLLGMTIICQCCFVGYREDH